MKYHFPESEQYEDIRTTDFTVWRDRVDVLTGGFPCQPFSLAGKRKGTADDRYLWPAMLGVVRTVRPRWVVGENVLGIVNWSQGMVFEQVCTDLEAAGYEVQAYLIPAAGVGAPHLRYRTWFVAHRGDARAESSWQERFGAIVAGSAADTGRVGLRERACEQEPVGWCDCSADARACNADGAVVNADGQRCYKFQSSTLSSLKVESDRKSRVKVEKDCYYEQALNIKNFIKRLRRRGIVGMDEVVKLER